MCGVLGVYFEDEKRMVERTVLKDMCNVIQHRGPDDEGYLFERNIGLGIRRLSVIDLVNGHQPIHNEDKTIWIILNGEIYNYLELKSDLIKRGHIFYTKSDTEVIVHLYEEKKERCVNDLNGMFAFAVLDTRNKTLFIARDHLGIKPLYYYNKNGVFLFASELKAILKFPAFKSELSLQALYHFFSLNYIPAPYTMFKDIKQLCAGHFMIISKSGLKITQYWDVYSNFDSKKYDREEAVIEQIHYMLKKSVGMRLRSDVPIGAFLSGGMDSSTLVSFITEILNKPLKTFSAGFKEGSYDESSFAHLVSERFDTDHYNVMCTPKDIIDKLPEIIWHADNLLADPSMLPLYLVSQKAKEHVTVCLSGDGGDELFMGYPTYIADIYLQFYKKIPIFIRKNIIERIINNFPVSTGKLSFEYKTKKFIEGAAFSPQKAHYWWRTVFNDDEKRDLFSDSILREIGAIDSYSIYLYHYNNYPQEKDDLLNKFIYSDIKVWLPDDNLIRVDLMTMAHSLEARVPFLDHELVEFMAGVPPQLKIKGGSLKYLLKKVMKDKLPEQIIKRQKAGWHIPLADWFQTDLRNYIIDVFSNPKIIKSGIIKKDSIYNLLDEHFTHRCNNSFKIWGLLVLFHWYDIFC